MPIKFDDIPSPQEWKRASSSWGIRSHKPKLAFIDQLVERYHQNPTSRLNILMALKDAIIAWAEDKIERQVESGRWEAMQALEDIVLRKLYMLDGWGKHRYLNAVCLGYVISTGGSDPRNQPVTAQQRAADELADLNEKCHQLSMAISQACFAYRKLNIPKDEDDKTLKIFMAPEFFFRGRYGAFADVGFVSTIFEKLSPVTSANPNWLFVLGTAVCSSDRMKGDQKQGVYPENWALVQRGGMKGGQGRFTIEKEFPSHVDFARIGSPTDWYTPSTTAAKIGGVPENVFRPEGGREDPFTKTLQGGAPVSEIIEGCIFTVDGLRIGLEVCRDHLLGRLAASKEKGTVQIQLIPSCGASIEDESISCVPGGIVFNVDGMAGGAHMTVRIPGHPALGIHREGNGVIYSSGPFKIPWPGLATQEIARKLKVPLAVLQGAAPPIPPRPPHFPGALGMGAGGLKPPPPPVPPRPHFPNAPGGLKPPALPPFPPFKK